MTYSEGDEEVIGDKDCNETLCDLSWVVFTASSAIPMSLSKAKIRFDVSSMCELTVLFMKIGFSSSCSKRSGSMVDGW